MEFLRKQFGETLESASGGALDGALGEIKRFFSFTALAIVLALLAGGCGKSAKKSNEGAAVTLQTGGQNNQKSAGAPEPEVQAPVKATDNYAIGSNGEIILKKVALNKEHLLRASLVDFERDTALFSGLKSRIVSFVQTNGAIQMVEATKGHKVSESIPTTLILTTFPILRETEDSVTINFNQGMQKVFIVPSWSVGKTPNTVQTHHHVVESSFIKNVEITDSNVLYIEQVVALRVTDSGYPVQMHGEVRYALSPYNPDPDYVPVISPDDDKEMIRSGYFTVNETIAPDGTKQFYASRFNPNKPIVFTISSNTPKEFQQAVKDGILYWNKAFGQDIVQAKMGTSAVAGPHPDHNMVQWLDWDSAGFARADAQVDPRTGQILNGQVMMTSSWAQYGKRLGTQWIENLPLSAQSEKLLSETPEQIFSELGMAKPEAGLKKQKLSMSLQHFKHSSLCDYPMDHMMATADERIQTAAAEGNAALVQRIADDTIRDVVAHEIGHVLGLRHNFAGSLGASYELADRDRIVEEYVKGGSPQVVTTSSVMEYQLAEESGITGDFIAKSENALKYDHHAIQKLYFGKEIPADPKKEFLFCPDGLSNEFADCKTFDIGKNPIEQATYAIKKYYRDLPRLLVYSYISAKTSGKGIESLALDPSRSSLRALQSAETVIDSLRNSSKLISIFRGVKDDGQPLDGAETKMYEGLLKNAQMVFLTKELEKAGGMAAIFEHLPENYGKVATEEFLALASEKYKKGKTFDGKEWEFTDSDLARMKRDSTGYFGGFDFLSKLNQLQVLGSGAGLKDDPADSKIASAYLEYLAEKVNQLVFELRKSDQFPDGIEDLGEQQVFTKTDRSNPKLVQVKVPVYKHHPAFRIYAALLLQRGRGGSDWAYRERGFLYHKLLDQQEQAFGGISMSEIDKSRLPRLEGKATDLLDWSQQFETLANILSPGEPE